MPTVVVTFAPGEEERKVLRDIFGGIAELVILSDLDANGRARALENADVLFVWNPPRELQPDEIRLLRKVRLVQLLSAGADHVKLNLPSSVTLASNAGAYAEPIAEHVVAMILALFKNLSDRHEKMKAGVFDQSNQNRMLQGSSCAILGFGGIGKATAQLLRCFGVRIYAVNTSGRSREPVDFVGTLKDLEHVLRVADIVVISLPLTQATRGLIGERELGWMKDDAVLINVARGDIIDEAALYRKLGSKPSFKVGIDVWWVEPFREGEFRINYKFLKLPNVLASPHNSGFVPGIFVTATSRAAENIRRFLRGEPIVGVVR